MSGLLRLTNNERGQVMMFGLFVLLLMLFFIGLIFNTGVVIMQKLQMQNAADAAALSGAVVQARGLSWMASENEEIAKIYADANYDCIFRDPFDEKQEGKDYILDTFPPEIEDHLNNIDYINRTYPQRAISVAETAAMRNVPGDVRFEAILPGHNRYRLTDYEIERHDVHFFYWFGIIPLPSNQKIDTFIKKDPNTMTYFAVKLTGLGADSTQLLSGEWFGSIPEITTYAAAKPYGGWIKSPMTVDLNFLGIDFTYPIWIDWTLPVVGNFINMKKHNAYLIRIGDRRLRPRPIQIPEYTRFQH